MADLLFPSADEFSISGFRRPWNRRLPVGGHQFLVLSHTYISKCSLWSNRRGAGWISSIFIIASLLTRSNKRLPVPARKLRSVDQFLGCSLWCHCFERHSDNRKTIHETIVMHVAKILSVQVVIFIFHVVRNTPQVFSSNTYGLPRILMTELAFHPRQHYAPNFVPDPGNIFFVSSTAHPKRHGSCSSLLKAGKEAEERSWSLVCGDSHKTNNTYVILVGLTRTFQTEEVLICLCLSTLSHSKSGPRDIVESYQRPHPIIRSALWVAAALSPEEYVKWRSSPDHVFRISTSAAKKHRNTYQQESYCPITTHILPYQ